MDVPDDVADRLYALPPRRFVSARDEAVGQARMAGDQPAASALASLRRPTVAAWLVNLLALRRPALLDELVELAEALRSAQRDLQGDQLRELTNQRRAAVSALVATARSLAVEMEPELAAAKLPMHEVEATLGAALADGEVAEQVRSGRLLKAVDYAGFGQPGGGAQLRLVHGQGGRRSRGEAAPAERPDREAAEAALVEARSAAEAAAAELERVTTAKREATQELAEIDSALAELAASRADAAARLAQAEAGELAARRAAGVAQNRLAEAEAAVSGG